MIFFQFFSIFLFFCIFQAAIPLNNTPPTKTPTPYLNKFNGSIVQTLWCGPLKSPIFLVLTTKDLIYRSSDYANTFENLKDRFQKPFEIVSEIKPNQVNMLKNAKFSYFSFFS